MKRISEWIRIRNFVVKLILAVWGCVMILVATFPFIRHNLGYLHPAPSWKQEDTILIVSGFLLAVGAAYYNRIIELILAAAKSALARITKPKSNA